MWKNVVNKAGYRIEVVYDNINWEEACKKEKELIKKYGRKDIGTGNLVNMTDGGEGAINCKHSKESIDKTINSHGYKNRKKERCDLKGLTYEEIYGEIKAKEIKEKQSKAIRPECKKGEDHHFFGKKRPEHSSKLKGKPNLKLRGRTHMVSEDAKQKMSIAKLGISRPKLECPYCKKTGGSGNMQRWHFDNCKNK